ncbi:MAG: UPF0175 family protein [Candidatus Aenigmarchaeota archaeon]|nr:UPF0175 family protein [Candidatus Aenigmarchaeota archaeon]
MQKTLSVRIDEDEYEFVKKLAEEKREDISKSVRELVDLGRLMYAIESYRKGKASIGKAAEIAGVSVSEMIAILPRFGIQGNLEYSDYLQGLENIKKAW